MRAEAEEKLASFYGVPLHPLPDNVELVAQTSDPASAIVAYAKARDADLIMMPTHGYGGFRGLLIGSTTAKILHDTNQFLYGRPRILKIQRFRSMCGGERLLRDRI